MATTRYVKRNAGGGWDVLREGDRRASVTAATQAEAVKQARELVRRGGGGEVRIMNHAGKIQDTNTVTRPRRPRRAAAA